MKQSRMEPMKAAIADENKHFSAMLGAEAKEAFMAFFQKRKPDFKQFN
jgi:1,4-dihydroxy-2-naphthoyl-CoA synthase